MSSKSLIDKSLFFGLDDYAHLATGGEAPMLKSHQEILTQFLIDKSSGEPAREKMESMMRLVQRQCAAWLSVAAEEIVFLSSASEGINNVAYGLNWQPGDNIVVADVEFPSDVLPWTLLKKQNVELRLVRHQDWYVSVDSIASLIDDKTRLVVISQVSMLTGQRVDIAALSGLVRASNAYLLVDATHAAGVVPVVAQHADFLVSSCYKWLLGVHGCAIFYCNRDRVGDFKPPFLGWNSVAQSGGWKNPTQFELRAGADQFLPGNPSFISLYLLGNALQHLQAIGMERIEQHALQLSGQVIDAVLDSGLELMTPIAEEERAGNVCFTAPQIECLQQIFDENRVLVWGTYASFGRIRISTHVHNDSSDVERCINVLRSMIR